MDEKKELIVRKSNTLIQEYNFRLSATEMKVFNFMVAKIKSPAYSEEFNVIDFSIQEFCMAIGMDYFGGSQLQQVKNAIQMLANKSAWAKFGKKEVLVRLIEKSTIDTSEGIIQLKLDDDLKPFLLNMSGYAAMLFEYSGKMQSKYSIYLYELLKSWDGVKKKEFELDYLKIKLGAVQKSYSNFAKFRQGALDIAVAEINEITDLLVSYSAKKRGRKVTHVEFSIQKKERPKDVIEGEGQEVPDQVAAQAAEFENQMGIDEFITEETQTDPAQELYEFMSDACNNEFNLEQIAELVELARPYIESTDPYEFQMDMYHFLQKKYKSLANKKIDKSKFGYLKFLVAHDK